MMKLSDIRVGIPLVGGKGWMGGLSHIELHVKAVVSLPKIERPKLYLLVFSETIDTLTYYHSFLSSFDGVIFVGSQGDELLIKQKITYTKCHRDEDIFNIIDFYFPVNFNVLEGHCAASWIHDFQHRYLPDFFSPSQIVLRDELCSRIASRAKLIFCSSRAVADDFHKFFPRSTAITKVLALRVQPENDWYCSDAEAVRKKYRLPERFILCSNQFWVHKNHGRLFEAIAILRAAGQDVHVVCTGETSDFRRLHYFQELKQLIDKLEIGDLVHILGLIPRHDQIQLIRKSLFVVQPSLFEGLSLIVQECRALGKMMVLSDLAVHLEHEYGIYFEKEDAQDLARKIEVLLMISQPGPDIRREAEARLQAVELAKNYAKQFGQFVQEAINIFGVKLHSHKKPVVNGCIAKGRPVIATSLMIEDTGNQQKAIESWLALGFEVLSVNHQADIPMLQKGFPQVEFAVAANNFQGTDEAVVRLYDILACLAERTSSVCGVMEPDTYLFNKNLVPYLQMQVQGLLVYTDRHNVESLVYAGDRQVNSLGGLFFDKSILCQFPQQEFCLHRPWWDVWMVLAAMSRNIRVKHITNPVAYHIDNYKECDMEKWVTWGKRLAGCFTAPFELTEGTIGRYHYLLRSVMDKHAAKITIKEEEQI